MSLGVVRVRGTPNVRGDIRETLRMLRLTRPNHCTVVAPEEAHLGMLQKAKDYLTWGELDAKVLSRLLEEKGRLPGDQPLTKAYVKKTLGFPSYDALSKAILGGKVSLASLDDVKPLFRLHPPRKGYEGTKRPFSDGGALGYRGEAINELIVRML